MAAASKPSASMMSRHTRKMKSWKGDKRSTSVLSWDGGFIGNVSCSWGFRSLADFHQHGANLLVQPARHTIDVLVAQRCERRGGLVVLEDRDAVGALVQQHPDGRIEPCAEAVLGHLGSDQDVADAVLHGVPRLAAQGKRDAMVEPLDDPESRER